MGPTYATMANNLKHYIKLSGKTQVQVAKLKGIQPESLSRHLSGRSQFSIQDAIEYAAILDCTPEDLLFDRAPVPIIGECKNGLVTSFYSWDQDTTYIQMRSQPMPGYAIIRALWPVAVTTQTVANTTYGWSDAHCETTLMLIDASPIKTNTVPQSTYGSPSFVKIKENEHSLCADGSRTFLCRPYPQPDGSFVLTGVYDPVTVSGVHLDWACNRLITVHRPDTWGWVEIEKS